MVSRFAKGIGAVMAAGTATGNRRGRRGVWLKVAVAQDVVETVAGVALGGGRNMGYRFHLGVLCR